MALAAQAAGAWQSSSKAQQPNEARSRSPGPCPRRPGPGAPDTTVGSIVGQHGTVVCLGSSMLTDVADLLIAADRSAAAIVDEDGNLLGAVTENDILQAYAEGMEFNYVVPASVWLRSGRARFPGTLTQEMTVCVTTPLCEAAEKMRAHALGEGAWRHLVVRDEKGALRGILSALDLARALCAGPLLELLCALHADVPHPCAAEVDRRIGTATVAEVMKPRSTLPTCQGSWTMEQVLKTMVHAHQNCALIGDGPAENLEVLGVVTPRDALRAFAEHTRLDVQVGHWLRGLRSTLEPRIVQSDEWLAEAAKVMATNSVHHLVVLSPESGEVAGVVSSSDLAQALGSAERVVMSCGPA